MSVAKYVFEVKLLSAMFLLIFSGITGPSSSKVLLQFLLWTQRSASKEHMFLQFAWMHSLWTFLTSTQMQTFLRKDHRAFRFPCKIPIWYGALASCMENGGRQVVIFHWDLAIKCKSSGKLYNNQNQILKV